MTYTDINGETKEATVIRPSPIRDCPEPNPLLVRQRMDRMVTEDGWDRNDPKLRPHAVWTLKIDYVVDGHWPALEVIEWDAE